MDNLKGPGDQESGRRAERCKGTGLVKKGDRELKCQDCKGTGLR